VAIKPVCSFDACSAQHNYGCDLALYFFERVGFSVLRSHEAREKKYRGIPSKQDQQGNVHPGITKSLISLYQNRPKDFCSS
jgi:hypothetical protein